MLKEIPIFLQNLICFNPIHTELDMLLMWNTKVNSIPNLKEISLLTINQRFHFRSS